MQPRAHAYTHPLAHDRRRRSYALRGSLALSCSYCHRHGACAALAQRFVKTWSLRGEIAWA
eukprot:6174988-Pleurochrysis_carterae.AAC.1